MAAQSSKHAALSSDNFEAYNAELQTSALKATKQAAFLPADLNFYRSLDRGLAKEVDASSSRVLSLANRLLDLVSTADNTSSRAKGKARLQEDDDVTDNFRSLVVDAMDQLLERADICLDDFMGVSKPPAIAVNMKPVKQKLQKVYQNASGRLDPALQHASHLPKPQLKFKRKVDNSNPWRPTLRHKYNAQVPIGYDLRDAEEDDAMDASSPHPYQYEIRHLSYPQSMFHSAEPIPVKPYEDTPFKWVSTPEDVADMLDHLRHAKEIAVDLEYHSYRSYHGFVCLMQISTREGDWVVDTLSLREDLEDLNEVFTNPQIIKVFHGAESDIVWLQQDFNLYIVNLFDTYHASKVLEFPRHGLATLMEMYCDFTPDKRYQLADWRIRPLPEEMLQYARSDTHFLLFIYDNLRNALLDLSASRAQSRAQSPNNTGDGHGSRSSTPPGDPKTAFVREVLSRSEQTALRVCEHERYDGENGAGPGGWDTLARKWNKGALMASERSSATSRIYRRVHTWRDRVAREEDESTGYVLPNRMVFMLAEQPPSDMAGLLGMFQHVNAVLRRRSKELLDTIREAAKEDASSSAPSPPHTPTPKSAEAMDVDPAVSLATTDGEDIIQVGSEEVNSLWQAPAGKQSLRASTSSVFNVTSVSPKQMETQVHQSLYVASRSLLFRDDKDLDSPKSDRRQQRFLEVVARIHDALVIAPIAPKVVKSAVTAVVKTELETEAVESDDVEGQVEMAFVPASQRHETKPMTQEPVKDSIVVVGQVQRKKRKRTKGENTTTKTVLDEVEAFDYSTAPNILDEGSEHEAEDVGTARKRKHKAHAPYDYGNFRAPPKALSQVKAGNQSHTFK